MAKKLKIFVAVILLIGFVLSTMDVKKTLFGALVATGVIPKSLLQGKGMGGGGMPPTLVSAKTLEKTNGDSTSSYVGVVRYANVSTLSAEVSGKVESVKVREGSYIKKNQTIMALDKGKTYQDMLSAKADSEQASLAYKQAKRDFLRVKSLYAKEAISKQEFEANQLKLKGAEAKADSALASYNKLRIDLRNKRSNFSILFCYFWCEKG